MTQKKSSTPSKHKDAITQSDESITDEQQQAPEINKKKNPQLFITLLIVGFFVVLVLVPTVILPALDNDSDNTNYSSHSFVGIDKYVADEGYLAPLFQLSDSDGKLFTLESFRGDKPVLLIFETTSCGYCRQESPFLEQMKQTYGDQVEIATVSLDNDPDMVSSFRSANNVTRPWLLDLNKQVAALYSSYSTPSHFFINKDGYIADLRVGYLDKEALDRYIRQLIQM